jgi:3-oxoacyl-[acyl-carrier protein] reductase
MKVENESKVVVLTGANSLIGVAMCEALLAEGYRVFATDLSPEPVSDSAAKEFHYLACDITDPDGPRTVVREAVGVWGQIDAIINNAGVNKNGPISAHSRDDWDHLFAVNLRAPFEILREAIDELAQTKGVVVNVLSLAAMMFTGQHLPYSVSKWALLGLTREAACEVAPLGIRVVGIAPGPTASGMWDRVAPARIQQLEAATPLGGVNQPADVADVVIFLLSEAARRITGAVLPVTGGAELSIVPV